MNDLISRRRVMGGEDAPVFVDWIENRGDAATDWISMEQSAENLYFDLDLMPLQNITANTGWMSLDDWLVFFTQDRQFRLWINETESSVNSIFQMVGGNRYQVTIAFTIPYQTTGYAIGVNSGSWSAQGNYKEGINKVRILRNRVNLHTHDYIMRWYGVVAFNSGVRVLDIRPCMYKGEYGFWDMINNKFHGNASGQGAFTGGYDN